MATVPVPTAGDPVHASWGEDVADAINNIYDYSRMPYALPIGLNSTANQNNSVSLAAVSGGNGGCIIIPFLVNAPMDVENYSWWAHHAASARSVEMALYRDVGTDVLQRVTGTDASKSFTATTQEMITTDDVSSAPVRIAPGVYWLAIRNTDTAAVHNVGAGNTTGAMGAFALGRYYASQGSLGATLDVSSYSDQADPILARINGRVFGDTAEFR